VPLTLNRKAHLLSVCFDCQFPKILFITFLPLSWSVNITIELGCSLPSLYASHINMFSTKIISFTFCTVCVIVMQRDIGTTIKEILKGLTHKMYLAFEDMHGQF
jgi:hypothetical protein